MITDFSPLKIAKEWKAGVGKLLRIPLYEVDTHNIVPCWIASGKQEFSARTFRPKITAQLGEFLTGFPELKAETTLPFFLAVEWDEVRQNLKADQSLLPIEGVKPGEQAAAECLENFINFRLSSYGEKRNDPNANATSNLSPYLHFGQISAQFVALQVAGCKAPEADKKAFLEELIVRRELSENYCFYNNGYDSFDALPAWAKKTLAEHTKDPREYLYTKEEFENAATHEELWNAAQRELQGTGVIHGYMRMYWAKKILEWSRSPEEAFEIAISLNDRYALDGREPNGYAGIAWAIGGLHDRAWFERAVYGKIRYMNASGCQRKFDVNSYIARQDRQEPLP